MSVCVCVCACAYGCVCLIQTNKNKMYVSMSACVDIKALVSWVSNHMRKSLQRTGKRRRALDGGEDKMKA